MALLIRDFHPDAIRGFALPAEVSPPSFRRKRPWCTTPSTWWPPPLNAPPRSPSAPCSATDTNPGASDHASWTCSKTWVRFFRALSAVIHPSHPSISQLAASPVSSGRRSRDRRIGGSDKTCVCDGGIAPRLWRQRRRRHVPLCQTCGFCERRPESASLTVHSRFRSGFVRPR